MPSWRRLAERFLTPWLDRAAEDARRKHSEDIRLRAIAARIDLEQVRKDYLLAAERLKR